MRLVEDFTRDEFIDWLQAYKGYSYADAVKIADTMKKSEAIDRLKNYKKLSDMEAQRWQRKL